MTLQHPGVVLLGCHLHGSMRGHVFVTDSGWTLKTDENGIARFAAVPDGAAQLRVWHAEQLVDLPRKALQVQPAPVLETLQLSVVPRVVPAIPTGSGALLSIGFQVPRCRIRIRAIPSELRVWQHIRADCLLNGGWVALAC